MKKIVSGVAALGLFVGFLGYGFGQGFESLVWNTSSIVLRVVKLLS